MRTLKLLILSLSIIFAVPAFGDYVPGELIVKFKRERKCRRDDRERGRIYEAIRARRVEHFIGILKDFDKLTTDMDLDDAIRILKESRFSKLIAYVERNPIMPLLGDPALKPKPPKPTLTDPLVNTLWGMIKIQAPEAWNLYRGGNQKIIVADIDTGIDYNHEDLSYNLWRNPAPVENDIVGWDFYYNDSLPYDGNSHGTHTAGTIGAVGMNGVGLSGVSQFTSIMTLKVFPDEGGAPLDLIMKAVDYAVSNRARIINNSYGSPGYVQAMFDTIQRAEQRGVLFVVAAGNAGTDNDGVDAYYPASYALPNVISVAATDKNDNLAGFSNYGLKSVHLGAPGVDINSTVPGGNKYGFLNGTSMACPHVAGAAALLWSKHPRWTYRQIKDRLLNTVDKTQELEGKTISGGRLNIYRALQ